jgi:hypothetical protein
MHPPLFSHPLRVNGMAGVSLAPMPPGIALKTAAARYAPLRLHLADRAGLPCLDLPSGRLKGDKVGNILNKKLNNDKQKCGSPFSDRISPQATFDIPVG